MSLELYAVVRPPSAWEKNPMPEVARDLEHAEALRICAERRAPDLGPYRVVKLVEQEAA